MIQKERADSLRSIPENADLLFVSNMHGETGQLGFIAGELYVVDAEGKQPVRITHEGWTHNHCSASPDRRYIVANRHVEDSNGDGQLDLRDHKTLYVYDLAKGEQWSIASDRDAGWGGVDWSPDAEWIYASMSDPVPQHRDSHYLNRVDIFRIRPDGTDLERLTDGIEKDLWDEADGKFVSDVGISPDGEWMAFCSKPYFQGEPYLKSYITVSRVDGSEPKLVTDGGPLEPGWFGIWAAGDFDPEFSPDSKSLVFGRATDSGVNEVSSMIPGTPQVPLSSYDIMRVGIDGSELQRLTPEGDPALKSIPDWSRDDRIVYRELNGQDGFQGPVIMNADGSSRHRVEGVIGRHFRWIAPL